MDFKSYLKQPFPKAESKWRITILISIFIALFLIVFEPFNINLFESNQKTFILAGYGLVTFIALVINLFLVEAIFPTFFDEKNWTLWKDFIWLIWIIFVIGLGNALYTYYVFGFKFNFQAIINFQLITIIVSTFPVTILIITKQKYLLNKNQGTATDFNKIIEHPKVFSSSNQMIHFYADNEKDYIEFDINDFFFIESSGNYIEINILKEGKIIRKTFRSTLKRALEFFKTTPEIIQCHRAFIVNTAKIKNAKGNSQGLILQLENCDLDVPVSRNYVDIFRSQIK
ncbi:MAG: LytTR family transcriptional regulator DNA-binding domain-containing protein [Bacteroidales bacterium]